MQKSEQREPSKLDWGWPSRVDFRPKVKNANLQNIQPFPGTDNPEYCNIALHLIFLQTEQGCISEVYTYYLIYIIYNILIYRYLYIYYY